MPVMCAWVCASTNTACLGRELGGALIQAAWVKVRKSQHTDTHTAFYSGSLHDDYQDICPFNQFYSQDKAEPPRPLFLFICVMYICVSHLKPSSTHTSVVTYSHATRLQQPWAIHAAAPGRRRGRTTKHNMAEYFWEWLEFSVFC